MEESSSIMLWLSDLGITVSNFEDEFSNGYLLGQILYRYNFQDDFGQFSNKPSYALSNISKVQLSLERFNLKFDPHRIINKEPGYIKKILGKIHIALHSINFSPKISSNKAKSIKTAPHLSNDENLSIKLKKFEDIRFSQAQQALEKEKTQREMIFKTHLRERSLRIETLKSNKTFMQTWQQEGLKNWTKNQNRRKERIFHENTVKLKLTNDKVSKIKQFNEFHMIDANEGIKEFEKNMIRLGIDYNGESEKKIVKQDLAVEAAVTMAKIKENKKKTIEAAKEREVRQRNSYIQQKKNEKFEKYKEGSKKTGNSLIKIIQSQLKLGFSAMQKYCKKIKSIEQVEKNINKYKTLSDEKWGAVNKQYRAEIDLLEASAKKELFEKKKKWTQAMIQNLKLSHETHSELCQPIAKDIILLADQAYKYIVDNKKIPNNLWVDWLNIFKNKSQFNTTEAENSQILAKIKTPVTNYFDIIQDEYNHYLEGNGRWGPIPANYSLGDVVDIIIDSAFPLLPSPPIPEGPSYLSYKIIILGPSFSGKKTQAKKISDQLTLKIFEMPKIIEDAKKVIQKKSEPEDLKKKKVGEEESEIFIQASLEVSFEEESGRSKLFRAKIRGLFGDNPKIEQEELKKQSKKEESKAQGYILLNYPNSLQEAVDLERVLSGFVHPSELPPELRDIKKKKLYH